MAAPTSVEQVSNKNLLAAITGMKAGQNQQSMQQFLQELFRGTYIVPLQVASDGSNAVKVVMIRTPDGQTALPVFTDSESYLKFNPQGMSCTILQFGGVLPPLFESQAAQLLINPGNASSVRIPREQIQAVVQQVQSQAASRRTPAAPTQTKPQKR